MLFLPLIRLLSSDTVHCLSSHFLLFAFLAFARISRRDSFRLDAILEQLTILKQLSVESMALVLHGFGGNFAFVTECNASSVNLYTIFIRYNMVQSEYCLICTFPVHTQQHTQNTILNIHQKYAQQLAIILPPSYGLYQTWYPLPYHIALIATPPGHNIGYCLYSLVIMASL